MSQQRREGNKGRKEKEFYLNAYDLKHSSSLIM